MLRGGTLEVDKSGSKQTSKEAVVVFQERFMAWLGLCCGAEKKRNGWIQDLH